MLLFLPWGRLCEVDLRDIAQLTSPALAAIAKCCPLEEFVASGCVQLDDAVLFELSRYPLNFHSFSLGFTIYLSCRCVTQVFSIG